MIAIIRSEWIKFRSIFANWVLIVIGLLFPVVIAILVGSLGDIESGGGSRAGLSGDLADLVAGTSIVTVFLLGAAATISITAEFAHSTIRPTYAATPNRVRVLLAKVSLNTVIVGVVVMVTIVISWLAGSIILNGRGASVSFGEVPAIRSSLISVVFLAVIVSWFGFGIGLLIRNSPAAVVVVVLWPLLIEGLIALALTLSGADGATKWLPYGSAIDSVQVFPSDDGLGRPGALLYFGAIALGIVAIGAALDQRRDA